MILLGRNYVASLKNKMRDASIVFCGEIYKNVVFALLRQSAEPASLGVCLGQCSVPVMSVWSDPSTVVCLLEL